MRQIATMSELAECAGHMGYSAHDYPGCPERVHQERKRREEREAQAEMASDVVNKD